MRRLALALIMSLWASSALALSALEFMKMPFSDQLNPKEQP
jgi:hypothetical protein